MDLLVIGLLFLLVVVAYLYFVKHLDLKQIEADAKGLAAKVVGDLESAVTKPEADAKAAVSKVVNYLKSKL